MNLFGTSSVAALAVVTVFMMGLGKPISADENVYKKTVRCTVWVVTKQATGSGVLVDKANRLVITNEHVVKDNKEVTLFFPVEINGRRAAQPKHYTDRIKTLGIKGTVIATNDIRDMAVIQLERLPKDVEAIRFGKPAQPGAKVHSVGNPGDSDALWVYTSGQVRANYYKIFSTTKRRRMQVLETQAPINPGDSGGPIVNDKAELVGIAQSFSSKGRLISHGVDISEISWFLNKVRSSHKEFKTGKPSDSTSQPSNSAVTGFTSRSIVVGDGKQQTVYVANDIDSYQKIKTRRVWSLAHSYGDQKIPQSATTTMLEQNGVTKIGGWVLEKGKDGQLHVIFLAHANVNADDDEMASVIDYVAKVTAAMKKRLDR